MQRVAILGAGAFGTALALVAERAGRDVVLCGRNAALIEETREERENALHLRGVDIPESIALTTDLQACLSADLILLAVPAQATRAAAATLAEEGAPRGPVLACAKGIEQGTGRRQSEIIAECLPGARVAALSGPGFAEEIARGQPTAVTIAAADLDLAHALSTALAGPSFRPYASDDLIGVELGGAVKNVLAIACGIAEGRRFGDNARAALVTRGLAELTRLCVARGGQAETMMGLSGLGDLILTCSTPQSRNFSYGVALGKGEPPPGKLAEGVFTAPVLLEMAHAKDVEMPISAAVAAVLSAKLSVDQAIESLMARPFRAE
jgi:glycerol-3-phosphate dehydrogenase (NAD(P)+)